jgi:dTDP-glucose pyrophosphorylase
VNKGQLDQYKKILPDGNNLGIKISYEEQDKPRGLPDAFIIGENFIKNQNVALILGDNFFKSSLICAVVDTPNFSINSPEIKPTEQLNYCLHKNYILFFCCDMGLLA